MSISITQLVLMIVCSAILVFFAEEFGSFGKKTWKKQWVKILLPLIGVSIIAIMYEQQLYVLLRFIDKLMYNSVNNLYLVVGSFPTSGYFVHFMVIITYTIIPYGVFQLAYRVFNRAWFDHSWELMLFCWLFVSCIVLIDLVHFSY